VVQLGQRNGAGRSGDWPRLGERASGRTAAKRRGNTDTDEQAAGNGRPEPRVIGRLGAAADRGEGVKHEVADQPPEPQCDRPHRLEPPRKPRVREGGDDRDRPECEDADELKIHHHPDNQMIHEMGDRGDSRDGEHDSLCSHLA